MGPQTWPAEQRRCVQCRQGMMERTGTDCEGMMERVGTDCKEEGGPGCWHMPGTRAQTNSIQAAKQQAGAGQEGRLLD